MNKAQALTQEYCTVQQSASKRSISEEKIRLRRADNSTQPKAQISKVVFEVIEMSNLSVQVNLVIQIIVQ